jgi:hypothetical protein
MNNDLDKLFKGKTTLPTLCILKPPLLNANFLLLLELSFRFSRVIVVIVINNTIWRQNISKFLKSEFG